MQKFYVTVMVQTEEQVNELLKQEKVFCIDAQNLVPFAFNTGKEALRVKDNCVELIGRALSIVDNMRTKS